MSAGTPEPDAPGGQEGEGTGGGSQEDRATTPPAGGSGSQEDSGNGNDLVPRSEVTSARNEAKNLRDRLRKTEEELNKFKEGQMSDLEKATKTLEEKDGEITELRQQNLILRVGALAPGVGIVDPEAAAALVDWSKIEDPNDSDQIKKALRELVKAKPYLAGQTAGGGDGGAGDGSGAGGAGGADMNKLIRARTGRA